MRQKEFLRHALAENLGSMTVVGDEEPFEVGAIDLPDHAGIQLRHQIGKTQINLSCMPKIVPR